MKKIKWKVESSRNDQENPFEFLGKISRFILNEIGSLNDVMQRETVSEGTVVNGLLTQRAFEEFLLLLQL